MAVLVVRQIRSEIGVSPKRRGTLRAMGLRKIGDSRSHEICPSTLGMVAKVIDLVSVSEQPGDHKQRYPRTRTRAESRKLQQSRNLPPDDALLYEHWEDVMRQLNPQRYEFLAADGEEYPASIVRLSDVEWIKFEPDSESVGIHWSTSIDNAGSAMSAVRNYLNIEKATLVLGYRTERDADRGSLLSIEKALKEHPEEVNFLLAFDYDNVYQWRENGELWQLGWLGSPSDIEQTVQLWQETGSPKVKNSKHVASMVKLLHSHGVRN